MSDDKKRAANKRQPKVPPVSDLAFATTGELIDELRSRSENMLLYLEYEGRTGFNYWHIRKGDAIRLHGVIHLRILPDIRDAHDDAMKKEPGHER